MSDFLFAFILCLLAGWPSHSASLVARLSARLSNMALLSSLALLACITSAAVAVWAGTALSPALTRKAALILLIFALCLAALEAVLGRKAALPQEPTRSAGAITLALFMSLLTDAGRFLLFALAALTLFPLATALGGVLASFAVLMLAALAGDKWDVTFASRKLRYVPAGLFVTAAIVVFARL
ncbi:hypothetical protein [Altericroceibacterium endophyticum]|uniref:GDT1 family protein n=1 Tax=Altericroceibacterium endophyticum TaxID=1808508 RepID=A0A6I4TB96_9SPHN|nr:hypothetical protein [Altericroceibacterium endophyticum]MXO67005.1 hypothetical protein [Altericroceibacterium endophyticum]